METDQSFETAIRQLEKTVNDLEGGRLGLDDALARYETGVGLLARCVKMLDEADRKVAVLTGVDPSGAIETAEFDATATLDREVPAPRKKATKPKILPESQAMDDLPF
jgi:exodeoxyribonuclease VII small subunit